MLSSRCGTYDQQDGDDGLIDEDVLLDAAEPAPAPSKRASNAAGCATKKKACKVVALV